MLEEIKIPNRFESLREAFGNEIRPLILPIEDDLKALNRLRERTRVQNGGLLSFLTGPSGIGKTTCVHSAIVNMPDLFAPVVSVPQSVSFRDAAKWIRDNTPTRNDSKTSVVLVDGRELSDDDVGLSQMLSSLNQFLRLRSDVIVFWPTTDKSWQTKIRQMAETIGGANFCPKDSDYGVQGPKKSDWPRALERLLLQYGRTHDDIGVDADLIARLAQITNTIGDFLTEVSVIVAERLAKVREAKRLPLLLFVITSDGDVIGEANRIRRAGKQILAAEPLMSYSPRSEAGKWWTERNKDPNHHLAYMISLFEANLVTMSASAVVYSCLQFGEQDLSKLCLESNIRLDKGNAKRTIQASELYRFLSGTAVPEFTTGRKGSVQDATRQAYQKIQAVSAKRHKAINMALCKLVGEHLVDFNFNEATSFEVAHGGNVVTDAVVRRGSSELLLEFHHLSERQCKASVMASYIMEKIRGYALHHQLIPR